MEKIIELLGELIDDIERDPDVTKTIILETLYDIKSEMEDINLQEESYQMYLSMIVCIYVSCAFGRGFETHHLHKDSYLKYGGDWI